MVVGKEMQLARPEDAIDGHKSMCVNWEEDASLYLLPSGKHRNVYGVRMEPKRACINPDNGAAGLVRVVARA